ncbi:MAG: redox-sensing transcriptional repressor Rex [Acidobacteria bacterium]|nr:MAG: redox-sensing transcriptional repressor Rex [Acidobacteriota bacterium]
MSQRDDVSSLTLNRLSVYLRCLRQLQQDGETRISSQDLARRFHLSAAQIRKDLAQFGEFGIRGVGYQIDDLRRRLESLLGVDREHRVAIVGAGNLGTALARFPGFNSDSFRVVAVLDNDPQKVGRKIAGHTVCHSRELPRLIPELGVQIGILAVPAAAAQENYDALARAGVKAVLNFAPVQLETCSAVPTKSVDLMIFMEELSYFLR